MTYFKFIDIAEVSFPDDRFRHFLIATPHFLLIKGDQSGVLIK
ncbi:hypothetical protein QWZ16_07045 [Vibrio ostreicida]|uniref:Uncharacterized protein n=1 Tax=Vibrio ostreicida TaxID=526588 RepID=A0ABT8BTQ2_9VIBR|nr:hypothetical protein [Vibrio ostreicida]MDN3609458.1 hypothetical protein [Vibrio ostreicida]